MKKNKKVIAIFIVVGLLLFGVVGYKFYNDFIKDDSATKKISTIEFYGYELKQRDTEVFKNTFKELETTLNEDTINYENYAKLISKLFIIDVYTLSNKLSSTDIGGLDYLQKDLKENFQENMGSSLYKTVESNLDGKRTQELPTVASVNINSVFETTYTYNKVDYKAYIVDASWDYVKDLGYQSSMKLTIINDNKILYIVKGK